MKKVLFKFLLFGCILPVRLFTQTNFLDTTFASNGSAIITLNANGNYCSLEHAGLQSDGKIIAVGTTTADGGAKAFAVRLNADGSRDASFGNGGEWLSEDPYFLISKEVLIQPDDKIVLTGRGAGHTKVVRLNPDGVYDNSFGEHGQCNLYIWAVTGQNVMVDMELQPDGKILVSGYKNLESAIVRLNVDGSLDTSFGSAGIVIVNPSLFLSAAYQVYGLKLGLSSDNSILAAGVYTNNTVIHTGFIIRFNTNGQIDSVFGENGISTFYDVTNYISDLFVLPNDEILVLCNFQDEASNYPKVTLSKWLSDGQIDSSFANQGYAQLNIGNMGTVCDNGFLQPDGKVVVLNIYKYPASIGSKAMMSRFNANGSIDTSIGVAGVITAQEHETFYNGLVQPDGKILSVSNYSISDESTAGNIRRYLASNTVGAIESASAISSAFLFPNPVTENSLTIAYELLKGSKVKIDLIGLKGEFLQTLINAERPMGKNEEILKLPENLETGTYFVNIQSESGNAVAKFLFIGH
ncbi:MAG: T9SS type A sorting domain-containing protein [Saprospiraceae bacterium]|nr:T9SS type A sorting domain-containing protein [Saprospiraceae bacterium]